MTRPRFVIALCALTLCIALGASASASPGPVAHASRTCKLTLTQQRNSGSTYLVQLSVSGVTCSTGLKVEKAWQSCRRATPGHRTCKKHVLGYGCRQTVLDSSKTQYDARVTCTSGSRVVKFVYTQNT